MDAGNDQHRGLKTLGSLLERFKEVFKDKEVERVLLKQAVEAEIGVPLPSGAVSIKGAYLHIAASPIVRSEIALRKEKIIAACAPIAKIAIKDIRF